VRRFAAPFVLTVACSSKASETTTPPEPPPPTPKIVVAIDANEAPPPPPPEPTSNPRADRERRWALSKAKGACSVTELGVEKPTSQAYACPNAYMPDGAKLEIQQHTGSTDCYMPPSIGGGNCPPNMACNPPPPTRVSCPK
jgi:hypothetical protein